jgi:hypothetical protein
MREKEKKNGRGRGTVRDRENKKIPCRLASINHFALDWRREREEKKNVPHIPL